MKPGKMLITAILLCVSFGAAKAQKPQDSKPASAAELPASYVIGESDLLAINVWHEPELTRVVPVRTDEKISLPLIGELQASGLTAEDLRITISAELKKFLEAPEVTVSVQEPRSQVFTIVGKVLKPGSYPLGQRVTVIDGIAIGGGFKDFAKVGKIYVVRTHRDGRSERLPFDYKRAVRGDMDQNYVLEARDMIIVP
jgi:polysaccharide biosynthesis/export protein